ncbi:MAG TPA: hypothetical protein VJT08_12320 [Terriglobales bacterium]|nr:hypothetical protein [Terriglobales bacterium]
MGSRWICAITSRHWCGKSDGWTETVEKMATRHEYLRAPRVALFDESVDD